MPDTSTIFRELIAVELRAGRLTPLRRARIVRYASQIGLSAAETGQLIAECRDEAFDQSKQKIGDFGLRIVDPPARLPPLAPKVAITTGILLLMVWLLR